MTIRRDSPDNAAKRNDVISSVSFAKKLGSGSVMINKNK